MKNYGKDTDLNKSNLAKEKNSQFKKKIITDVNILLNRVRLDEKKDFRKKLTFLVLLLTVISLITFFAIF
jgi:hypothetical protein